MATVPPHSSRSSLAGDADWIRGSAPAPSGSAAAELPAVAGLPGVIEGPKGWKRRLEDPFNTYYRYPVALGLTKLLVHTGVTPNQVSLVQPLLAAGAGYLVASDRWEYHLGAVALFELRSILDCVDGTLARAKKLSSPNGHAIDAMADWLGVVLLHVGIFVHLARFGVPGWSTAAVMAVAGLALFQGAARSFASDYFKTKFLGIFERNTDENVVALRDKLAALGPGASLFAHIDVFILRMGHLSFEGEWFRAGVSKPMSSEAIERMQRDADGPRARLVGHLWSLSNGDAFLTFIMLSILSGSIWPGQLFFATVGVVWIALVMIVSVRFFKSYR